MEHAMDMDEHSDTDDANGDGEGVWSPDIEQCFREALLLFPPCGRRKHILQEEGGGKMYGRNELIARHIRMRTGKIRTRKQVSSHIQVLARRKAKAESSKDGSDNGLAGTSSPAASVRSGQNGHPGHSLGPSHGLVHNQASQQHLTDGLNLHQQQHNQQPAAMTSAHYYDVWTDRPVVSKKLRLVEFSAFVEYRRQLQVNPSAMTVPSSGVAGDTSSPALVLASLATSAQQPVENLDRSSNNLNGIKSEGPLTPFNSEVSAGPLCQQQPLQLNSDQPLDESVAYNQNYSNGSQQQQPLNNNQQHHQQINQSNSNNNNETDYMLTPSVAPIGLNYQTQASSTSSGFTRHSYVKIDYRQPTCRQTSKLERIDINQIQDKFPELVGSEGLYQRGPPEAFFLVKFWADLNNNDYEYNIEDQNSYFGFSCHFESLEPYKDITCSTKACSYGLQVVEKVEKIHGALNNSNGRYSYAIDRSPMCEFMIQFIKKLRQLPRASQMNSVLENFTVLQVITSESTSEILLCLAFVFEIASRESRSQYHVYKL